METLPNRGKAHTPELIGVTVKKAEDFSEWYQQVILKGQMLEFYDVPGCYIHLPASKYIWNCVQAELDRRFSAMDVEDTYFPIFITEANLQREKEHIEGFAAEVAWVTHGGKHKLENKIAIRPTSETAIYPFFSKRIRSHRDLPLKVNQWTSVVRWEFKHPIPFIRAREFLWQEGHTAHLTKQEADSEVYEILDHYASIYEDLLAVPVVKGTKTDNEKFAGAEFTTTVEGFVPLVGRGIQGATSHGLGQHFSEMFDISVEDPGQQVKDGEKRDKLYVFQNSWGFSTRSIGLMIMTHGDDKGLVIPPRVAKVQVVIVPVGITAKTSKVDCEKLYAQIDGLAQQLKDARVRVYVDKREGYSPGYKFHDHELKGVPLRLEFGPRDSANGTVATSRRDGAGSKGTLPLADIPTAVPQLLETIQADMFARARDEFASRRKLVFEWKDFVPTLNQKNALVIPHCLGMECEDQIRHQSTVQADSPEIDARAPSMGAKSLCIPREQPREVEGLKCINPKCGQDAKKWVMFGRSY